MLRLARVIPVRQYRLEITDAEIYTANVRIGRLVAVAISFTTHLGTAADLGPGLLPAGAVQASVTAGRGLGALLAECRETFPEKVRSRP